MQCLDDKIAFFLDACESWANGRLRELALHGAVLSDLQAEEALDKAEEAISSAVEDCVSRYGELFPFELLEDLYRMLFELELQNAGIDNAAQVHRLRANGNTALAVIDGTMDLQSALLVMRINQAHMQKKGGAADQPCDDCMCGRK